MYKADFKFGWNPFQHRCFWFFSCWNMCFLDELLQKWGCTQNPTQRFGTFDIETRNGNVSQVTEWITGSLLSSQPETFSSSATNLRSVSIIVSGWSNHQVLSELSVNESWWLLVQKVFHLNPDDQIYHQSSNLFLFWGSTHQYFTLFMAGLLSQLCRITVIPSV